MSICRVARGFTAYVLTLAVIFWQLPPSPAKADAPDGTGSIPQAVKPPSPKILSTTVSGPDASWSGGRGGLSNASAQAQLAHFQLGSSLPDAVARLGAPWVVVYQGSRSYWMYRTDGGHAWLVLGSQGGHVDSIQASVYAHDSSSLRDAFGVALGGRGQINRDHGIAVGDGERLVKPRGSPKVAFYGVDRTGRVDRMGRAISQTTLAPYARWYEFDGHSPARPIPAAAYGGTVRGEQAYIGRLREPYIPCVGGNRWHITARQRIMYTDVPIDELVLRCGKSSLTRPFFFALRGYLPQAYTVDTHARAILHGESRSKVLSITHLTGTTGQIWSTTPNGTRMTGRYLDFEFAYIDDPNNPLQSVTAQQVPFSETAGGMARRSISRAATPQSITITCSFTGSGGKCTRDLDDDGQPCLQLNATFGSTVISSAPICFSVVGDPFNFAHPSSSTGSTGCTGAPVDATSGNLWYAYDDARLSGPFGLSFSHRYDSTLSTYQGDLGRGWRDTYGAYLDVSDVAAEGFVTFYDRDCNRAYLQSLGSNSSSYDQVSGATLYTQSDGTYKLVTWDQRIYVFNAQGQLVSLTDRAGNTQTINRNGSGQVTTVVDSLGRQLSFTYDSSNRITSISSNPSGVSISFSYTSILGSCYSGDLCSVTESDGSVWQYEYYNPSSNQGNHLLKYVIDPLGHTEEYNQYQQINLGNNDNHYRVTAQSIDSGVNAYAYAYSAGLTSITDALGHITTYGWDQTLQQVTSVSGYLCFCRGDSLEYTYNAFGRPTSIVEGGDSTLVTADYGRDLQFVSPDRETSYTALAYPSITEVQQPGILTSTGFQTKTTKVAYYDLETPQQDLPQTVSEPSVDTRGVSATTTYTFSTQGLPTNISRIGYSNGTPSTHSISASYDARGRILTFTGPRTDVSQTTTFTYYADSDLDAARRGQLRSIQDSLGHTTTFATAASPYNTYSIFGGPRSTIDANSVTSDFDYDLRGRLNKMTLKGVSGDPTDLVTTLTHNELGQLTSTVRPLGNSLAYSYDTSNRPSSITIMDASGNQHEQLALGYSTVSQLLTKSAEECSTPAPSCSSWQTMMSQTHSYATVGTLATVTDPAGGQTSFAWDKYGNNTGSTSGTGPFQYSTTNGFDASHLLTSTQLSGSTNALYTHDLQGNLTRVTTPSTASTNDFFDDFGCLRKQVSTYTGTTSQSCDRAGNVTSRTDANSATTTTTYDALNRPLSQTSSKAGVATETVTWTYDSPTFGRFCIGRLASMTDPSGSSTYSYDRRGLLVSLAQVINGTAYSTTYAYDGNGNRITERLPISPTTSRTLTYTYDDADRPYSVSASGTTYVSSALYEPFGPRSQVTYGNGTQQTITYDQRYLPLEAKVTNASGTLSDLSYTENSAGYLTKITDNLDPGYSESLSYGGKATNMLTQVSTGSKLWGNATYSDTVSQNLQTASFPGRILTYGYSRTFQLQTINQSGSGTQSISHDAVGNQTAVGTSTYAYSSRELLSSGDSITYTYDGLGRRVVAQAGAGTRTYMYDPDMHLQAESSLTSGSIVYQYVWFGGTPVAQINVGGATHWTANDQRGAPFLQTDSSGNRYWQADYEPFGAVYSERTSDVHQPLRLPGQEAEQFTTSDGANGASGRFYNGFRWYRPSFGRYTQADPMGYMGSVYDLYSYANNNPYNYTDFLGLECGNGIPWLTVLLLGAAVLVAGIGLGLLLPDLEIGTALAAAVEGLAELATSVGSRLAVLAFWAAVVSETPATQGLIGDIEDSSSAGPALDDVVSGAEGAFGIGSEEAQPGIAEAFHYTSSDVAPAIQSSGLAEESYATTASDLSPLQAQIDLALPPNRGLPDAIVRIDLQGLSAAGYELPALTQVARQFNLPGGGYEMFFPYQIPPQFITWIK